MPRFVVAVLLLSLIVSLFLWTSPPCIAVSNEIRKVYILCLPFVGGNLGDPQRISEGAVRALSPDYSRYDSSNVPLVNMITADTPPFVDLSYEIVVSWQTLKSVVEQGTGIVIVNCHDEILPVPLGYTRETWTDKIAEAMLERHVTWVNVEGYPFYYSWEQGASEKDTWGAAGLQRLMGHIGKGDAYIPYLDGTDETSLSGLAETRLGAPALEGYTGWDEIYKTKYVKRKHPLQRSQFEDYVVLPIWNSSLYYDGAVLAFVQPNEAFNPLNRTGCGFYVHIGPSVTYDVSHVPTDADYFLGYVGCAAAMWTLTSCAKGSVAYSRYSQGDVNFTIAATSTLVDARWISPGDRWEIDVGFFIYGWLKRPWYSSINVDRVNFYVAPDFSDGFCEVCSNTYYMRNAYPDYSSQLMVTNYEISCLMLKTLALPFSWIDPSGLSKGPNLVSLYNSWTEDLEFTSFNDTSHELNVAFYPHEVFTDTGQYYDTIEFQSLFTITLKIEPSSTYGTRHGWRTMPVQWGLHMVPTIPAGDWGPVAGSNTELAVYFPRSDPGLPYTPTVFFDNFDEDTGSYQLGDTNQTSGTDYWGRVDYVTQVPDFVTFPSGKCYWCAAVGTNSLYGESPNTQVIRYDRNMNAFLQRDIELRPYQNVQLIYLVSITEIESGDYLDVYARVNGYWSRVDHIVTSVSKSWRRTSLPPGTTSIKYVFCSDSDTSVGYGAYVYYIEIQAKVPNDADTNTDAGNDINSAMSIGHIHEFTGYLDNEDWCSIQIDPGEDESTRFRVFSPENAAFEFEIYYPSGGKILGPSDTLELILWAGTYKIGIRSKMGFGPYRFEITHVPLPPGGGGGGGGSHPLGNEPQYPG